MLFSRLGYRPKQVIVNSHSEVAIDLQRVEKEFETPAGRFKALNGIDLVIKAGDFVSIIGKSGSGKSTLLNMVTGIDRPTAGKVFVGGAAIHDMSEEQVAIWRGKTIGVIFQFFQLLPTLTVVENVMLAMDYAGIVPQKERPERAMQILAQVGMTGYAHAVPGSLSGGQQQVVAIARSLANDPAIITADEPTGNLDSHTANAVFGLFEALAKQGKTIIMVTHDPELAGRAGRIIMIADGRVTTDRSPREDQRHP